MGMVYSVKFHQKFHIISMVMKLWSQKTFSVYKFSLPPNTTSPNGNVLEWILWRQWDDWSWTSMTIKVAKRFFNQNYTNFSFLLPPFIIIYQMGRKSTFLLFFHFLLNFPFFYIMHSIIVFETRIITE